MIRDIIFGLRSQLYRITSGISSATPPKIILCYHSVGGPGWEYNVKIGDFKQQIEYLLSKFQSTTLDKIIGADSPSFSITFDDGYKSITGIREYLQDKKIRPTLFLLSNSENLDHQETENNIRLLNHRDVRKLINSGWEIGSHGSQHRDYWNLRDEEIYSEIVESKKDLESRFQMPIKYFSYPKGRYTSKIVDIVKKAGYKLAVTMDDGILSSQTNHFLIPRVGVDRTQDFTEYKRILATSTILTRKLIKQIGGKPLARTI
jgi:peptidoglycan/xylan/chitin deacetylase (PgdA/CDA1 family)